MGASDTPTYGNKLLLPVRVSADAAGKPQPPVVRADVCGIRRGLQLLNLSWRQVQTERSDAGPPQKVPGGDV